MVALMLRSSHVNLLILIFIFHLLTVNIVYAATIQGSNSFSLELIPKFSKKSPMCSANLTDEQRYAQMLQLSRQRSPRLAALSKYYNQGGVYPNLVNPQVAAAKDSQYIVTLKVGTPPADLILELDTGSSLIWAQCSGCNPCFENSRGSFNFYLSNTYQIVDCHDPICVPRICSNPELHCEYSITYGDKDNSKGVISKDDFQFFTKQSGNYEIVKNVFFGCGFENRVKWGKNTGPDNIIGGLFGMGRGAHSFHAQLGEQGQGRFSYCLTNALEDPYRSSWMRFGDDANYFPPGSHVQSTPLRQLDNPVLYFVNLLKITMNGGTLKIPPNALPINPRDRTGGMLIDTGNGPTAIVESAFEVLEDNMDIYFGAFDVHRFDASGVDTGYTGLEVCYWMEKKEFILHALPTVTFHFEGADFTPAPRGLFAVFDKFFCLQIVGSEDYPHSILGAFTQVDHYFVHDTRAETLSFAKAPSDVGCQ